MLDIALALQEISYDLLKKLHISLANGLLGLFCHLPVFMDLMTNPCGLIIHLLPKPED